MGVCRLMEILIKDVDPIETFDSALQLLENNWKDSGNPYEFVADDAKAFYTYLYENDRLFAAGVYKGSDLIGYVITSFAPHPLNHSIIVCNVDGVYLMPEYRKGTASGKIFKHVAKLAREQKANYIHWHAPSGTQFYKTLEARYKPLSVYFVEEVLHE